MINICISVQWLVVIVVAVVNDLSVWMASRNILLSGSLSWEMIWLSFQFIS